MRKGSKKKLTPASSGKLHPSGKKPHIQECIPDTKLPEDLPS